MKRLFILLCPILILFQACTRGTPQDALVIAIESPVKNLDPRFATDAYSQRVVELMYSGLVRLNEKSEIVGDLATHWDMPDDKTYVFHLREGVTFHDGTPLTVEDIKYTFASLVDPETGSPYKTAFEKIESVEATDSKTIKLTLHEVNGAFLIDLTVARIIPKHADDLKTQALNNHPIGNGPYQFVKKDLNKITLKAFPNHFWKTPKLGQLIIRTVADDTTRIALLKKKEVDLIQNALPSDALKQFVDKEDFFIQKVPSLTYKYLGMNLNNKILKNKKVRGALAYALNTKEIIQYALDGLAIPATSILSPESPFYEENTQKYFYDIKKAKQLLDEAGYPELSGRSYRFSLTFKTSTAPEALSIAKIIANQLKKLNINVEVVSNEWGTFYSDIKNGNFELFSLQWVGVTEPDIFYNVFHSSMIPPHGANRGYYKNHFIDQLTEQGRKTVDLKKRKAIYSQIQKMIAQDLPYIHLWHQTYFAVAQKNVQNLILWPTGSFIPLVDCTKVRK
ncbi:MAG: ABC transporter substrate-binding protein [Deltaproteobacteria bacterium]|nr:ABC transporter substrate-binding protein [Deltaproteobacteria bacterium]